MPIPLLFCNVFCLDDFTYDEKRTGCASAQCENRGADNVHAKCETCNFFLCRLCTLSHDDQHQLVSASTYIPQASRCQLTGEHSFPRVAKSICGCGLKLCLICAGNHKCQAKLTNIASLIQHSVGFMSDMAEADKRIFLNYQRAGEDVQNRRRQVMAEFHNCKVILTTTVPKFASLVIQRFQHIANYLDQLQRGVLNQLSNQEKQLNAECQRYGEIVGLENQIRTTKNENAVPFFSFVKAASSYAKGVTRYSSYSINDELPQISLKLATNITQFTSFLSALGTIQVQNHKMTPPSKFDTNNTMFDVAPPKLNAASVVKPTGLMLRSLVGVGSVGGQPEPVDVEALRKRVKQITDIDELRERCTQLESELTYYKRLALELESELKNRRWDANNSKPSTSMPAVHVASVDVARTPPHPQSPLLAAGRPTGPMVLHPQIALNQAPLRHPLTHETINPQRDPIIASFDGARGPSPRARPPHGLVIRQPPPGLVPPYVISPTNIQLAPQNQNPALLRMPVASSHVPMPQLASQLRSRLPPSHQMSIPQSRMMLPNAQMRNVQRAPSVPRPSMPLSSPTLGPNIDPLAHASRDINPTSSPLATALATPNTMASWTAVPTTIRPMSSSGATCHPIEVGAPINIGQLPSVASKPTSPSTTPQRINASTAGVIERPRAGRGEPRPPHLPPPQPRLPPGASTSLPLPPSPPTFNDSSPTTNIAPSQSPASTGKDNDDAQHRASASAPPPVCHSGQSNNQKAARRRPKSLVDSNETSPAQNGNSPALDTFRRPSDDITSPRLHTKRPRLSNEETTTVTTPVNSRHYVTSPTSNSLKLRIRLEPVDPPPSRPDPPVISDESKEEGELAGDDAWEDYCFLCAEGCDSFSGALGCCASCPKVFHRLCHVPACDRPMEKLPDNWQCGACIEVEPLAERVEHMPQRALLLCAKVLLACFSATPHIEHFRPNDTRARLNVDDDQQTDMNLMRTATRLSSGIYNCVDNFLDDLNVLFRTTSENNAPQSELALANRQIYTKYAAAVKKFLPAYIKDVWHYTNLFKNDSPRKKRRIISS